MGESLAIHGHGLRRRDQWGPPDAAASPGISEIIARRYRCVLCKAVLVVAPRGPLPRRLYSGPAIALALALFGIAGQAPDVVRKRISPLRIVGASEARRWRSLGRWARAARAGPLFGPLRTAAAGVSLRQIAERVCAMLIGRVPSSLEGLPLESRAMLGAAM